MATQPDSTEPRAPGATPPAGSPTTRLPNACDLVMKGGITSGVIYPKLIGTLAAKYQFRNIGGTSAGAIAAGACAAAEYGCSHGKPDAFADLEELPDTLGAATAPSGRSKLFTLFQPNAALRQHFGVLVSALNTNPTDAAPKVMWALLKMHPFWLIAGLVIGNLLLCPLVLSLAPELHFWPTFGRAVIAFGLIIVGLLIGLRSSGSGTWFTIAVAAGSVLAVTLAWWLVLPTPWHWHLLPTALAAVVITALVLAVLVALVVWLFGASLLKGLHGNGYGICSGRTADLSNDSTLPGLTDWLTAYFNKLAGLPEGHRPLTFGDLWGTSCATERRNINLEVMTSAVSQQMVYGIPFRDGTPPFYYDPQEWSLLFPPDVLQWLHDAAVASPAGDNPHDALPQGARATNAQGKPLRVLPRRADLPVVVAVRMSLSFPILLSAVPLYAIDFSCKKNKNTRSQLIAAAAKGESASAVLQATRIWFSDGGIGSNMPLHMFDALLPGHPTFAVNLKAPHPDYKIQVPERADNEGGRIYLPQDRSKDKEEDEDIDKVGGHRRHWAAPADEKPLSGLIGFLRGIVDTMQNWRDEILFPYPGFRDRIIQISQRSSEGGLNLDMPRETIIKLAKAGGMAGQRLVDRFHINGAEQGFGWSNHQSIRLGTFLGTMQPGSAALHTSLASGMWATHLPGISGYRAVEAQLATDFLKGLQGLGALSAGSDASLERGAHKPLAQVRIGPRI